MAIDESPQKQTIRVSPGQMEQLLGAATDDLHEIPGPGPRHVGTAPGIEVHDLLKRPTKPGSATITCIDYSPEQYQVEEVKDFNDFIVRHRPLWSKVRWINIAGLTDMAVIHAVARKYELHPLAIEDVLHRQRPKADDFMASGDHPARLFVVAQMVERHGARITTEQISFFLGRNTLITFEEDADDIFDPIRQRLKNTGTRLRNSDVSFLFYSLLDTIIDYFFPLLEYYSEQLTNLEGVILGKPLPLAMRRLHKVKRELLLLRRCAWAMRDLVNKLQRESHQCLSDTTRTYFRDVYDHIVQIVDFTETYREIASGLAETYISSVSNRMNEIVKTLTIISTIFVPLTFLVGVYGMNMPIPENEWRGSYPIFWAVALTAAGSMLYWFRRRGWF